MAKASPLAKVPERQNVKISIATMLTAFVDPSTPFGAIP